MKLQNLSTRAFLRLIVGGASLTSILLLFILYAFTKDIRMILGGFSVMILLFLWGAVFLHYFQKKLSVFTDGLCRTLDEMMDSTVRPQINYEAETLLARISHRLERLYHVMQETRHKVEEEKAELQSLVSDISHQTKTPIATSIIVRKRELSMLQSIGMSGQQLKLLLVLEGLYYVIGTVIGTLILSIIISFGIMRPIINSLTWFQFDFTIVPLLVAYPILLMLAIIIPLATYRTMAKESIVKRLRTE